MKSQLVFVKEDSIGDVLGRLEIGESAQIMFTKYSTVDDTCCGYVVEFESPQVFDECSMPDHTKVVDLSTS